MSKASVIILIISVVLTIISIASLIFFHIESKEQQLRLDVCNHTIQMQAAMLDDHE
jgi:flagellar basal body-associated protein FliL